MTDSFNLVKDEWIPVLFCDGQFARVGMRTALSEAGKIRQIAASNPMDNVALLRFLLAVLLWCKGDLRDEDRQRLRSADGIPDDWLTKLDEHKEKFNLLGEGERFYQDKRTPPNDRPIGDLLVEFPTETKIAHFRHVRDKEYGLCPACCALGIVRFCAWANAYAGGQYTSAVNGPTPAYAIPHGATLQETLELNMVSSRTQSLDPPWLSDNAPTVNELHPINVFAWRSRKLWLGELGNQDETCSYCGQHAKLIRQLAFTGNWKPPFQTKGQQKKFWDQDPHLIFEEKSSGDETDGNDAVTDETSTVAGKDAVRRQRNPGKKKKSKVPTTLGFPSPGASVTRHTGFWRRALRAILARPQTTHAHPRIVVGPAANKGLYQDATAVSIPPILLDSSGISGAVEAISQSTDKLMNVLRRSTPDPGREHPNRKAAMDALTPDLEIQLRREAVTSAHGSPDLKRALQGPVRDVVLSSTAGSPLRRREAMDRANSELSAMLRKLAVKPQKEAAE